MSRATIPHCKNWIVKLGTQLISRGDTGGPDPHLLRNLMQQVAELRTRRVRISIVCSGAVGAGCSEMGFTSRPTDIAALQATAAVGQRRLIDDMHFAARQTGQRIAQVLLSRGRCFQSRPSATFGQVPVSA